MRQHAHKKTEGSLMVTVLILLTMLSLVVIALALLASSNLARASLRIYLLQTQYSAESGADVAISRLNNDTTTAYDYTPLAGQLGSETDVVSNGSVYRSTYQVKMADGATSDQKIITSIGRLYVPSSNTTPKYTRTIRITAKRNSTSSSGSMVSRNIIELASAVKAVWGKDFFVNNYIKMDKNVNRLIAENITVAGKDASGGSCSINGAGSLKQPSTYTDSSQTKTVLNLAYNNCIPNNSLLDSGDNPNPSGYTINANKTDILPVQSTYIPWGYKMTGYGNATNGCSDWTTLHAIPSPGNTPNLTHYPDSSAGISSTCGTNGVVDLSSSTVTITDHAHLRANLCSPLSPCAPTFNNPTGQTKFVFVEGTISFAAFKTAPGSAPIVFVAYGADPSALSGVCPLGGAVFLDKTSSDNVNAPAAYLIAVSGGLCINGTKFAATKALGGISGKNIYLNINSGNPFDLSFDPAFPVNQIPINLSWKASTYERL